MSRVVSMALSSVGAVAVHLALAVPAFAQDPVPDPNATTPPPVAQQTAAVSQSAFDRAGLDLGVRLGYALPFGNTAGDSSLGDGVSGAVPVVLEAGYRLNANLTVGALFQYGIAQVKDNATTGCGGGVSCSGRIVRLGVEAIYNLNLQTALTPWVGLGTGYEWFSISGEAAGQTASVGARGFEFATLHAGGDYRLSPQLAVGPFVSFSLARYSTASIEGGGMSMSMDIPEKRLHEWLQLGIRGRFGL